jgi:hypothetical protein
MAPYKENRSMNSAYSKLSALLATLLLGVSLAVPSAVAADKPQGFTGRVSDAMCGAHHMMAGDPAACTRACIEKGSKYVLVVGEKVYVLDTSDQSALDKLNQLADKPAKVTGQANGDTITVTAVSAAK